MIATADVQSRSQKPQPSFQQNIHFLQLYDSLTMYIMIPLFITLSQTTSMQIQIELKDTFKALFMIQKLFIYQVTLIISLSLFIYAIDFEEFVRNHSFVFISGWPQSGTSFVHQVFSLHNEVSTMVDKCEKRLGKRCINWNHEGQWLIPGKAREVLNSGAMCPHQGNLTTAEKNLIMSEWEQYWSLDRVFLVEKSPQSMLKIPLLRELFHSAISVKFIIIAKHPVTLNIATPKGYTWTHHSIKTNPVQQQPAQASKTDLYEQRKLIPPEQDQVARFFIDLMTHDNATLYDERDPRCSMGWLPAMKRLHQQLQADDAQSRKDVRIVRFEAFSSPRNTCKALLSFALALPSPSIQHTTDSNSSSNSNGSSTNKYPMDASMSNTAYITQLCDKHFGSTTTASTTAGTSSGRSFSKPTLSFPGNAGKSRKGNIKSHQHQRHLVSIESSSNHTNSTLAAVENSSVQHRVLRLRTTQVSRSGVDFHFIPELVVELGRSRVIEFLIIYRSVMPKIRLKLDEINVELKLFGYNLLHWQTRSTNPSILAKWEL